MPITYQEFIKSLNLAQITTLTVTERDLKASLNLTHTQGKYVIDINETIIMNYRNTETILIELLCSIIDSKLKFDNETIIRFNHFLVNGASQIKLETLRNDIDNEILIFN